jgi:hypothetical protein
MTKRLLRKGTSYQIKELIQKAGKGAAGMKPDST